ncbi:MAG: methionine adenosyltransferase [Zetaproteobacteria bacterium]|nr:methionine adenosyltransferase [Zetaproteobacteria bacterium]
MSNTSSSNTYLFTSESVGEGHPDKVADQISDGILDALLEKDSRSRVACETLVTTGLVMISGEITSDAYVDFPAVARDVIKRIGYDDPAIGFDYRSCGVVSSVGQQSADIAQGVNENEGLHAELGAGDQGMMFGYACNETDEYMPATISYSHQLLRQLAEIRHQKKVDWLRPDAKGQVCAEYENGRVKRIDSVVISTQHAEHVKHPELSEFVVEECIKKVIPQELLQGTRYHINPTGKFVVGGPKGDCGLTGRKIIVDTYGGHGAHGGGAFSGKDPTKVDRSAAYMARYVAKNLVAAGLAERCLLQVAYAIGVAEPVSVFVNTYGTGKKSDLEIAELVKQSFGFKPVDIIRTFDLLRPIYSPTAAYGHFGRLEFPWERLDRVNDLK